MMQTFSVPSDDVSCNQVWQMPAADAMQLLPPWQLPATDAFQLLQPPALHRRL